MFLFTREARLVPGNQAASIAWALSITEKVNQITELNTTLWTRVFSPGVGMLGWTALVEDLSVLEASDAKLMADTGFQMLAEEGAKLLGTEGLNDRIAQFVTPFTAPPADAPLPNYANLVVATLAPGAIIKGIEVGLEIAERASEVTGIPTSFLTAMTGGWGEVQWTGVCETVEQLQAARLAMAADPTLIQLIDTKGSAVYQPDAQQLCYRRLA